MSMVLGRSRRESPWRHVPQEQWDDWRWQARSCIRDLADLEPVLRVIPEERQGVLHAQSRFPMSITPYYAALADADDPSCPVRMQAVPRAGEAVRMPFHMKDPLAEDSHMPVPGLVHRYPDRALLLVNNMCPVYCRYCLRKRLTGAENEALSRDDMRRVREYLRAHDEVREVILSGGEPLFMADARLGEVLSELRTIGSVKVLRVHTRVPVVMPQRITAKLARTLRGAAPLWLVTHFNHPKELTPEAVAACERLADAGIPVSNQTVLLRRVNSSARILEELFDKLLSVRVRPYYLHQCDLAEGLEGFRTPISAGLEIMRHLEKGTGGLALPRFVLDCPGGGGKVALSTERMVRLDSQELVIRDRAGGLSRYPEPADRDCRCPYDRKWVAAAAGEGKRAVPSLASAAPSR